MLHKSLLAFAAAALPLSLRAQTPTTTPTTEELLQKINLLQAQVEQLRAQQQTINSRDVDATVEAVLRDADRRSQLLQMEGFTAGWSKDKGFRIQDASGTWSLHPNLQFQFRSITNHRNFGKQDQTRSDTENGFEIRRLKLGLDGTAFTPNLSYFFLWNTQNGGDADGAGALRLEEGWIRYYFGDTWAMRAGQITNPAFHEQTLSSRYQLAVERSLVNQLVTGANQAYTQAVTALYDNPKNPLQIEFGIDDGFASANGDFTDKNEGATYNYGVTGRVNYFIEGSRDQYKDFSAKGNKTDLLVVGAGADVSDGGDSTNWLHTVDVQYENTNGFGIYGSYYANYINGPDDSYNWGGLVEASYLFAPKWEVFGRYDYTRLETAAAGFGNSFNEFAIGVNWYVGDSHAAKITFDVNYLPNGVPSDQRALGYLATDSDEIVIRGQFQLLL